MPQAHLMLKTLYLSYQLDAWIKQEAIYNNRSNQDMLLHFIERGIASDAQQTTRLHSYRGIVNYISDSQSKEEILNLIREADQKENNRKIFAQISAFEKNSLKNKDLNQWANEIKELIQCVEKMMEINNYSPSTSSTSNEKKKPTKKLIKKKNSTSAIKKVPPKKTKS